MDTIFALGTGAGRAAIAVIHSAESVYDTSDAADAPTMPKRGMRIRLAMTLTTNEPTLT